MEARNVNLTEQIPTFNINHEGMQSFGVFVTGLAHYLISTYNGKWRTSVVYFAVDMTSEKEK